MTAFSFIHTADLHLDSAFAALGRLNPDLAAMMRSATFEAFESIIDLCIQKEVDFLLIAGDVYDGADRSLRAQVKFRDGLKRLDDAGIRTYVVHGNHDPLNVWSSSLEWPKGVHLFKDSLETVTVKRDNEVLSCVQGISYPKRDERRNLSKFFKRTSQAFHIGLVHANVGSDTGHEAYAPCSLEDLRKRGMDYWALGHVHTRKILLDNSPVALYPGNPQGRNIRETGEKGCYHVKVSDNREIEETFFPTDVIRWNQKEIRIDRLRREQDLLDALNKACLDISEIASDRPVVTRIFLAGRGPLSKTITSSGLQSDLLDVVREMGALCSPMVWIEQIRLKVGPEWSFDEIKKRQDFLGELFRYSNEIRLNGDLETLIRDEMSPLFNDSRARRFIEMPDSEKLMELLKEAELMCLQGLESGGED